MEMKKYEGYLIHHSSRWPGDQIFTATDQVLITCGQDFRWVDPSDPRAEESLRRADAGETIIVYDGYRSTAFRLARVGSDTGSNNQQGGEK